MIPRLRPYLVLAGLWAVYFHPLFLNPTGVLYADFSDFLAEHLPAKVFLNHEWRTTGELPLWNPYHFCGTPFVHDIQVGCFYPPYAIMYVVPEVAVGAALSWVIALHVLMAGLFAYVYARSKDFGEVGALVAAVGFMLAPKWMTHLLLAGHTITVGLAWLPLVLLGLERAMRRDASSPPSLLGKGAGGLGPTVFAGVAFALLVLGTHPQWTFYAGVLAAAWTFPTKRPRPLILRWLACGLGAVVVALLLTAVQLLPTWEAAGQSARTVGLESTQSLRVGFFTMFGLVGPTAGYDPPRSWEERALLGVFWLAAALAARPIAGRRFAWHSGVFIAMLAFSAGGAVLVEWLPGFRLFRIPSRMLLVAVFPLAYLAGATTDALLRAEWHPAARRGLRRFGLGVLLLTVVPSLTCLGVMARERPLPLSSAFVAYWVVVGIALPVAVWLCLPSTRGTPRVRTACWLAVLLAELLAPTLTFPTVRSERDIFPETGLVRHLKANAKPGEARVLDIDIGLAPVSQLAPLGVGGPEALIHRIESPRGYNPLDVRHYREFVGFVVGIDEPILSLSPVAQPVLPNFSRTHRRLFDLLNVRYLVCYADYVLNPELRKDPGHALDTASWRFDSQFADQPAVPPLPPQMPDPVPRVLVIENRHHAEWPRAFVVPEARSLPTGKELATLSSNDFRKTVLVSTSDPLPANGSESFRAARIADYRPNRVTVDLAGGSAGFLVLSDVWFPGWTCRIDDVEVPVYRANHAFRAVAVPSGAKEAVFAFEPRSYRIGWWVSALSLGMLALAYAVAVIRRSTWR